MPNIRNRPQAPLSHSNDVEHRRLIAQRANVGLPTDGTAPMGAPLPLKTYALADLPSAADYTDCIVTVTDPAGGYTLAVSDGTNWKRTGSRYVAKTSAYTVVISDYLIDCSGTFTVTLPTAVGITDAEFCIKNSGTGEITVDADGTETIDDELTKILIQYDAMKIMSNGANWIIV